MTVRFKLISAIASVVIGFFCSAAYDALTVAELQFDFLFIVHWLIYAILLFACFAIAKQILNMVRGFERESLLLTKVESFYPKTLVGGTAMAAAVICIFWSPYLFAMFPGNLYMDTSSQLCQFFSFERTGSLAFFNMRHPVFDTLVFGSVIDIAYSLTGNFKIAIFVLVFLQCICTAVSFSFVCNIAYHRWNISFSLFLGTVAFFAIVPLFPILVSSISKDSFFSWIFLLFFASVVDIVLCVQKGKGVSIWIIMLISLSGALLTFTKSGGVFIALFSIGSLVFLPFGNLKRFLQVSIPCIGSIVVAGIIAILIPQALGVSSGGAQEALSVPLQQTALTVIRHEEELPDQELERISKVINIDSVVDDYKPQVADGIKGYKPRGSSAEYIDYMMVWLQQGLRFPGDYFEAWALLEAPIFSNTPIKLIFDSSWTSSNIYLPENWHDEEPILPEDYNIKPFENEKTSEVIKKVYEWLCEVPFIQILFMTFTYAVFLPTLLIISLLSERRVRTFLPVVISLGISLIGLFLSPIAGNNLEATRYLIPFIYIAPMLLIVCRLSKTFGCDVSRRGER